jgi:hypothetical protein
MAQLFFENTIFTQLYGLNSIAGALSERRALMKKLAN